MERDGEGSGWEMGRERRADVMTITVKRIMRLRPSKSRAELVIHRCVRDVQSPEYS